jgi:hypothetical protein
MLHLDRKAGSFAEFLADVTKVGKLVIVEAFRKAFVADVTGQEGERGYIVKGQDKTWIVGADCLTKAAVSSGLEIVGQGGKIKVSIKGKAEQVMTEEAFERTPLHSALVDAFARQKSKASDKTE